MQGCCFYWHHVCAAGTNLAGGSLGMDELGANKDFVSEQGFRGYEATKVWDRDLHQNRSRMHNKGDVRVE